MGPATTRCLSARLSEDAADLSVKFGVLRDSDGGFLMLHLEELGTFVEVADAGGAARRLGVSNPSSAIGWSGLKRSLVSSFWRGRPVGPHSPKRA
jgi:hypothetical protein